MLKFSLGNFDIVRRHAQAGQSSYAARELSCGLCILRLGSKKKCAIEPNFTDLRVEFLELRLS